ncbi:hypothetical protein D3C78_1701420 [compost metagenome]
MGGRKAFQALAKTCEAIPAALHGLFGKIAFGVEAAPLAHGFLEVFHALEVVVCELADFQAETVGAKIDGSEQQRGVGHGECWQRPVTKVMPGKACV